MKIFITLIFSVMLVSCPQNQKESFTTISKASLFGAGEEGFKKENIIISSNKEWNSFLLKLDSTNKISDKFQSTIDFTKEMVVVAVDGVKNSGGFAIEIVDAEVNKENILLTIKTTGPKATDMVAAVMLQPYHIIKINKTDKKIKFLEL
jgi:hypothetical protein